ncbi:MAG: hypothetical protein R3C99_00725 [Pirellulaceae bacterium]
MWSRKIVRLWQHHRHGDTGSNSTLERNVVYLNVTGIQTGGVYFYNSGFEGTICNNVIYANSSACGNRAVRCRIRERR